MSEAPEFNGGVTVASTPGSGRSGADTYTDHFVNWPQADSIGTRCVTVLQEKYGSIPYAQVTSKAIRSNLDAIYSQYRYQVLSRYGVFTSLACAQLTTQADVLFVVTMYSVKTPDDPSTQNK